MTAEKTLYDQIAEVADRQGDVAALIYYPPGRREPQTVTYRQFLRGTQRLVNWLRGLGVGESDVVAYLVPDSPLFAMLSCAAHSCCTVFEVDVRSRLEYAAALLAEVRPRFLICARDNRPDSALSQLFAALVGNLPPGTVLIEIDPAVLHDSGFEFGPPDCRAADFPDAALSRPLPSDLDRTVNFRLTSGTTGRPKLVPRSFRALLSGLESTYPMLGLDAQRTVFGLTFYVFYMPCGARFLLRGIDFLMLESDIARPALIEHDVTDIVLTPNAMLFTIGHTIMEEALARRPINVWSTGARLLPNHHRMLKSRGVGRIFEFYGSTEAGLMACGEVRAAEDCGRFEYLRAGLEVKVVDGAGDELPRGAIGLLAVRGGDLNEQRFVDGELVRRDVGEWHLVGDNVRIDEAGRLVVVGRTLDSVNIREAGLVDAEVLEARIAEAYGVQQVGVASVESPGGWPFVALFIVPGAQVPDEAQLLHFVRGALGPELVQVEMKAFFLQWLPLTPLGKLDRLQLTGAAVHHIYNKQLRDTVAEIDLAVDVEEDAEQLLRIAVSRRDGAAMDTALHRRLTDFFFRSPYKVDIGPR